MSRPQAPTPQIANLAGLLDEQTFVLHNGQEPNLIESYFSQQQRREQKKGSIRLSRKTSGRTPQGQEKSRLEH
jgi:hypothetical protein